MIGQLRKAFRRPVVSMIGATFDAAETSDLTTEELFLKGLPKNVQIRLNFYDATVKGHFQPQGLTGVGLTTGDKYQATGVTQEIDHFGAGFPIISTFINNFRFIGAGPGNNLLFHEESHVTINANGVITALVDHISLECR